MTREYSFMLRVKRAGRGNDIDGGIAATKPAEVAVPCWACPREGVNLPQGWQEVDDADK